MPAVPERIDMDEQQDIVTIECAKHGLQEAYKDGKRHRCKICAREKVLKYDSQHREEIKARNKQYRIEWKMTTFRHYSGSEIPFCACCGEKTIEFLILDHIDGGGSKHRKEIGAGAYIYKWAIQNNFPSIFRVLCYNCNCARGAHGYCPHEKEKASSF